MSEGHSAKANAEQGAIIHRFVHDLKNKVGALSFLAEMFNEQDETAQQEILGMIKKGSMEALRLSEELMDDLQIGRKFELNNIQQLDLSALISEIIQELSPKASAKSVSLRSEIRSGILINGQKELLVRIPNELIRNAIAFCSKGNKIDVVLSGQKGVCTLRIIDNGPGLSSEDLPNLFKRYLPLSNQPTDGESSSLRGLADVQLIAEAHNTCIKAQSEGKGYGCTFSIEFPLSGKALD